MLNSMDILEAVTEIEEDYIQDAHNFSKESKVVRFYKKAGRGTVAAVLAVMILGTTVYGGALLVKQLHIKSYNSVEELMREHDISEWNATIAETGTTFDETGFEDLTTESLIDRLTQGVGDTENYSITNGDAGNTWSRKLSQIEHAEGYEKAFYEAYEYQDLSDALSDYGIGLNLEAIQESYPSAAGEYGCDMLYSDDTRSNCLRQRFFSGYCDEQGKFVSVEYSMDQTDSNEDPYVLFDGKADTGYFITEDGAEVFLTTAKGTAGGTYVTAQVYTEHSNLYVGMYGDFEKTEIEKLLNSLEIVKGMKLEVK